MKVLGMLSLFALLIQSPASHAQKFVLSPIPQQVQAVNVSVPTAAYAFQYAQPVVQTVVPNRHQIIVSRQPSDKQPEVLAASAVAVVKQDTENQEDEFDLLKCAATISLLVASAYFLWDKI